MDLEKLGKSPISHDSPTGIEVRDTDQFSALQDEFAKLTNPSATTPPDASLIVRNASDLLANTGKDLMVATYLTYGLMRQNGLAGLHQGLSIVGDLIETYWDTLFPPITRLRGRRNSIQWLIDQTTKQLESASYEPQPTQLCNDLKEQIKRVDELLTSRDDESPALFRLLGIIDTIPLQAEAPPEPTSAPIEIDNARSELPSHELDPIHQAVVGASQSTDTPVRTDLPVQAPVNAVDNPSIALHTCQRHLTEIASVLLNTDVSNPLAFRLSRTAAWFDTFEVPPNTNGQTLIPPPRSQIRDLLAAAQGSQSWQSLIQTCEANITASIFWLDLHRISEQSLSKLGKSCDAARQEIVQQVLMLLKRLPDIHTLSFSDGTPFADSETKDWINAQNSSTQQFRSTSQKTDSSNLLNNVRNKAQQAAQNGTTSDALTILDEFVRTSDSGHLKLLGRIELCEFILRVQPIMNAVPYAESIQETIEQHELAVWDPALAVEGLKVVYKAYIRTPETKEAAKDILSKLATLSPMSAYQVSQ